MADVPRRFIMQAHRTVVNVVTNDCAAALVFWHGYISKEGKRLDITINDVLFDEAGDKIRRYCEDEHDR